MPKPRTEKVRKQDTKRQQSLRDRRAAHREAVGAEKFKMTMFAGTRADLDTMQQVGEFEEVEEAITLGIRYLAGLARRDPEAFRSAMDPRNPA
ncbi:hypothetical protein [Pseudomonas citronellolis]|uniref:hypothetical protein n=1 Tax=Pseudomonas citronellolis TaxID=53408 RepID=UPI0023E355AB|nr:hypothetical protein [Pseudomonas citronellolis]MDF3931375.1 hypothetical protein [Pseudomonas citronellolis]